MDNIRNLFKNNIFFTCMREDYDNSFFQRTNSMTCLYKSNIIDNIESLGITNSNDLSNKIKPLIYYLLSKHLKREENCSRYEANLQVGLFLVNESYSDEDNYIIVNKIYADKPNGYWLFLDREDRYDINESLLSKPFEIHNDIDCEYSPEQEEEEIEDDLEYQLDEEDKAPLAVSEPFHSDQCVVCLSKKLELLFVNCLHRCVCLECEKTSPFHKCP